jgi:hypothetical protein
MVHPSTSPLARARVHACGDPVRGWRGRRYAGGLAVLACLAGLPACGQSYTAPDASSDATPGQDGSTVVTYRALGIAGGLDRIFITRADPALDLCAGLHLVAPDAGGQLDIELPPDWGVELTYLYLGAATCHEDILLPEGAIPAGAGTGAITWDGAGEVYPSLLSIDVTLTFFSVWPWVPDTVDFLASDLSVSF